jgi:hypothetical protein
MSRVELESFTVACLEPSAQRRTVKRQRTAKGVGSADCGHANQRWQAKDLRARCVAGDHVDQPPELLTAER